MKTLYLSLTWCIIHHKKYSSSTCTDWFRKSVWFNSLVIKFLTNFKASVLQSGITVQRGCKQGDPVSPYLFILCSKILAVLIKHNKNIRGIVQSREHVKKKRIIATLHAILNNF